MSDHSANLGRLDAEEASPRGSRADCQTADGWTLNFGDVRFPAADLFEVKLRCGELRSGGGVGSWLHADHKPDFDVVAYRLMDPVRRSAPDLLDALRAAEYAMGNVVKPDSNSDQQDTICWAERYFLPLARAAIAKATGEQA